MGEPQISNFETRAFWPLLVCLAVPTLHLAGLSEFICGIGTFVS